MRTPVSAADLSVSGVTGNITLLELIAQDSSPANRPAALPRRLPNTNKDNSAVSLLRGNPEHRLNTTLDLYGMEDPGGESKSWTKLRQPGESKIFSTGTGIRFEARDENSKISPIAILDKQNTSRTKSDWKDTPKAQPQKAHGDAREMNSDPLYIFKPVDVYVKGFKNIENLDRDYRLAKSQERLVLARRGVKISQVGEPGYLTLRAREYFLNGKLSIFPGSPKLGSSVKPKQSTVSFSPVPGAPKNKPQTTFANFMKIFPKGAGKSPKSPRSPKNLQNDQTVFITSDATQTEHTIEESLHEAGGNHFGVAVNGRRLHSDLALQKEAKKKFEMVEDSKIKRILEEIFVGCERKIYTDRMNRRLSDIGKIKKASDPNYKDRNKKSEKQKHAQILKGLSNEQILAYYAKFMERKAFLAQTGAASPSPPQSPCLNHSNPWTARTHLNSSNPAQNAFQTTKTPNFSQNNTQNTKNPQNSAQTPQNSAQTPQNHQNPNTKGSQQADTQQQSGRAVIVRDSRSGDLPSRSVMWTVHPAHEGATVHQHSQVSQRSGDRGSMSGESLASGVQSTGKQNDKRRFKFKQGHFWFNPNAVDTKGTTKKSKDSVNFSPRVSKWALYEDQTKDFSFKPSYQGELKPGPRGRLNPHEQDSVAAGMQLSYFEGEQASEGVRPYLQDSPSQSQLFRRDVPASARASPVSHVYGFVKTDGSTTVQSPRSPPGKLLRQPAVSEFGLPVLSERIRVGLQQHEQLQRLPAYQTRLEELAAHLKKGEI